MQGMSFGHAGTIVEGKEDSATEKIARLEAAGIPVVQRIDEIPDLVKAQARRADGQRGVRADGTFIAVEVDDAVAADAELARKLTEACPVDIYAQDGDGTLEIVEREPRRVRALPAVPRRDARQAP